MTPAIASVRTDRLTAPTRESAVVPAVVITRRFLVGAASLASLDIITGSSSVVV